MDRVEFAPNPLPLVDAYWLLRQWRHRIQQDERVSSTFAHWEFNRLRCEDAIIRLSFAIGTHRVRTL